MLVIKCSKTEHADSQKLRLFVGKGWLSQIS